MRNWAAGSRRWPWPSIRRRRTSWRGRGRRGDRSRRADIHGRGRGAPADSQTPACVPCDTSVRLKPDATEQQVRLKADTTSSKGKRELLEGECEQRAACCYGHI